MWDISWPSYHHVSGISWHDSQRSQCFGLSAGRDDVKTWPWMMWKPSREETLVTRTKNSDWLVWSLQLPMKPIQICMIFPHTNTATKVLVTAPYTFEGKATKLMISCTPTPVNERMFSEKALKGNLMFQPSIFRCELPVFRRVNPLNYTLED